MRRLRWGGLKLSGKMVLFFVGLVLCQSLVTLTILTTIISRTNLDSLTSQMSDTILGVEGYLRETFSDLRVKGDLIAGQQKTVDYADYRLRNLLARELVLYRQSLGIESLAVYIDSAGPFASTTPVAAPDSPFRDELARALGGERAIFLGRGVAGTSLFVLSPIKRADRIIGALSLSLSMDKDFVARVERIINARVVLRFEGISVYDPQLGGEVSRILETYGRRAEADASAARNPIVRAGSFIVSSLDLASLGLSGGTAYCLMDTTESFRQIGRYNAISLLATLLILSLALASGIAFYQRTFLRRFQTILQGITSISRGDFNPPFRLGWQDEFGQLAHAFDDMCLKLLTRDKELSQLSRYNTLVLDSVQSGILCADLRGEITACNRAAERLLETASQAPLGRPLDDGSIPAGIATVLRQGLHEGSYASGREITIGGKDGERILDVASSPLLSPDGERIGIIVVFQDITKEKLLEEKLALSSNLAALGEMAAGVAHQVRNPLVVMKVSSEMLRDGFTVREDPGKYRKLTHLLVEETDALNLVVSNFLDFARPRKVQPSPCPVDSVIQFALESLPLERYAGIAVKTVVEPAVGEYPMDRNLMAQALSNLVLNALQASRESGCVEVRARKAAGGLRIEVQDWGTGMSEETMRKIFNPFFTTRDSGTGLGLSIAHRIVESHGGSIEAISSPGAGSTFTIVL